jgi:hypothetical protein
MPKQSTIPTPNTSQHSAFTDADIVARWLVEL